MFNKDIKFKYPWRPYQQKVLNQVEKYIEDKKVHIVAAPGSGKTILGLELARYLKNPVIIFAPTVTIKNQWVDRFVSSFTNYEKIPALNNNWLEILLKNVITDRKNYEKVEENY